MCLFTCNVRGFGQVELWQDAVAATSQTAKWVSTYLANLQCLQKVFEAGGLSRFQVEQISWQNGFWRLLCYTERSLPWTKELTNSFRWKKWQPQTVNQPAGRYSYWESNFSPERKNVTLRKLKFDLPQATWTLALAYKAVVELCGFLVWLGFFSILKS